MITFDQWREFCESLNSCGVSIMTAREFAATDSAPLGAVILKHDVEALPAKALETAKVEAQVGIRATYYFHGFFVRDSVAVRCMQEIRELGHEVGYHYDVLDQNDGDFDKALAEFESDLEAFAGIGAPIETVCPHGNPLKQREGWNSNKDFFKDPAIRERYPAIFDIVNDMDQRAPGFHYVSDAGFGFKLVGDIRHNDKVGEGGDKDITVEEIIRKCATGPVTVVSVHSHRLARTRSALFARRFLFLTLRRAVRILTRSAAMRRLLSPLFSLSKRF